MARWALRLNGKAFEEVSYLPGVHSFFGPMESIRKASAADASESTARPSSLPLLVQDGDKVLADDSWACFSVAGVDMPELKADFDEIGALTRSVAYSHLTKLENDDAFYNLGQMQATVGWWQRTMWSIGGFRSEVRAKMQQSMVGSDEEMEVRRTRLAELLSKLAPMLETKAFAGEQETPSSIALACTVSPALFPDAMSPLWGEFKTQPKALQEEIESWRATPVGIWALAYFNKHCKAEYTGR